LTLAANTFHKNFWPSPFKKPHFRVSFFYCYRHVGRSPLHRVLLTFCHEFLQRS